MKKLLLGTMLLAMLFVCPALSMARMDVGISISLPPLIVFEAPPELVVIPETNIYVVPDVDMEIFFFNGWWWRLWEDRWYRSRDYDSGWRHYRNTPPFYQEIPSDWRSSYQEHSWGGQPWEYQRVPHHQVQQNWRSWEKGKHWEKQNNWGVQGLQPRTESRQQQQQQVVQPKSRRVDTPQRSRRQSEGVQEQPQPAEQQNRAVATPQKTRRQPKEVQAQPQPAESQKPEAAKQANPRHKKDEKEKEDKQDKN